MLHRRSLALAVVAAGCVACASSPPTVQSSVSLGYGSSASAGSATTATPTPSTDGSSTPTPSNSPSNSSASSSATGRPPGGLLAGKVVVIDPGHNGANAAHLRQINRLVDAGGFQKPCNTTGTENATLTEATFTWELAQTVRDRLTEQGATVVLTRTSNDGWGPCVDERGRTAGRVGAAALISLHADGAPARQHGFHVIYPAVVAGHTEAIVAPSRRLATTLRDDLTQEGLTTSTYAGRDGIVQRGDLGTLNFSSAPAVMLEAGNMANPSDAALLGSTAGRDRIANAVVQAVDAQLAG